jgi:hypothetical protein
MQADRIEAYLAYIRSAHNSLKTLRRCEGMVGNEWIDREIAFTIHQLKTVESRFMDLKQKSGRAGQVSREPTFAK